MWSYFNENPIPYDLRKGIKVLLPPVKSFRFSLNSKEVSYGITSNHQLKIVKL